MRAPDQDARDAIVSSIGRNLVVEAGAGTGKTTLLVDRVLELLARGAPLTRLAVVTFTRKAAAELVSRIATRLAERRDAGEAWAAGALADLELADVGTTDSLCRRILEAFPLQAEVPPRFGIADEVTQVALREEAWAAFLEGAGAEGVAWMARLRQLGGRRFALRRLADAILEHRDLEPAVEAGGPSPDLVDVFERALEPVLAFLPSCPDRSDRLRKHLEDLARDARIARAVGGVAAERVLLAHAPNAAGLRYTRKLGRKDAWAGAKDDVLEALRRLDEAMDRAILLRRTELARELAGWVASYGAEYERRKRSRGLLDFRDLALKTRDLLVRRPDVRRLAASRWNAILLDEVQDTDPLQMEIAFLLASEESDASVPLESPPVPGRLFLVGDPKQSIYRFRRADIELYERAKRRLGGPENAPDLIANFRSHPEIVDLVNRIFDGWMEPPEDGDWQARYVPLVAARTAREPAPGDRSRPDGNGAGGDGQLDLFARSGPPAGGEARESRVALLLTDPAADPRPADARSRAPSAEVRGELERNACARLVRRILGLDGAGPGWTIYDRPVLPEEVAVLVRKVAWGDGFLEELRRSGVPASISGGRRFFAREEIQTLRALVEPLLDLDHRLALFAALRSPAFGISDDDLVLRFSDREEDVSEATRDAELRLRALADDARRLPVPELLERLAEELQLLPVFGFRADGAARVESVRLLLEAADTLADAGFDTLPAFARWLREQEIERPGPGDDEPGDLEGVAILTMHKAKGLEFPVVIVADLAARTSTQLDVVPDRRAGRLQFHLAGAEIATAGFGDAAARERRRQAAEEMRLLYVAMTRARDRLVLSWPEASGEHLKPDALPSRLGVAAGQPAPAGSGLATIRAGDLAPLESGARVHRVDPARVRPEAVPPETWSVAWEHALGPTPIVPATALTGSPEPEALADPPTDPTSNSLDTKALGTLVHVALEHWRPADLGPDAEAEAAVRAALEARPELTALAGEAIDLLARAFFDEALDPVRAALTGSAGRARREVPFLLPEEERIVSGTLDVLLEEPDGSLVVIDWKTGRPPARAATDQAAVYARAVERLTGRAPREVRFLLLGSIPVGALSIPARALAGPPETDPEPDPAPLASQEGEERS